MKPTPCYVMAVRNAPWFASFKMGFDEDFTAWARQNPGVQWAKGPAMWLVPIELAEEGKRVAKDLGWEVQEHRRAGESPPPPLFLRSPADALFEWQRDHAKRAVYGDGTGRWIEASEMGLGKSPIALTAARLRGVQTAIFVDTAGHRRDWFDPKRRLDCEFGKWWPGHPEVKVIEDGDKARTMTQPILVTSYHLLHKIPLRAVGMIVFDEAHMLQNPETLWSKAAKRWVEANPQAFVLALTGTLCPDQPMTMFNVLDTLWPGRFGTKWDFAKAYSIGVENDFGKMEYAGVRDDTAPRLAERLRSMTARTTKLDVGHLLPAFGIPKLVWSRDSERPARTMEWVHNTMAQSTHCTVLTHLRKTAHQIVEMCDAQNIPTMILTGEDPPAQRHEKIKKAKAMDRCVIVATLHSVTTGVDLTFACRVLFAEIYPRPVEMIQVLGRFHRMTSTEPATIGILAKEGGDFVAEALLNKIRAINLIMKAGQAESSLDSALREVGLGGLTREQAMAKLLSNALAVELDEFN